ncbi:hypothetical protein HSX10_02970 [Winogradskyella undariae]|uniref:hypothetical protein n=1 Tax=Winogradskyella undariae TaxID=1285465 RepID=UPI00156B5573|nr:hypothetical protein [Winogradskyella undariae]NRR90519.1 hypothetical protein [Winogradskyella undariae]
MKKIILFFLLATGFIKMSYAHNPLSAMYYLEVKDDFSILNISLSQVGLNEAISKYYKDDNELSEAEYKELIVKYVRANFNLNINDSNINLLDGGVKLGNHQTDLKFITSKVPSNLETLNIKIDAFKENEHHQTIFSMSYHQKTSKVILNEANSYTSHLEFVDNKMVEASQEFKMVYLCFFFIIPAAMVVRKVFPSHKL